jgi:hypothetical protein
VIEDKEMRNLEILKTYQDRIIPDFGERMLWAAVLLQAIADLDPKSATSDESPIGRARIKQSALFWIKSSDDSFNSFIGICETIGICPDKMRQKVLNGGR